MQITNVSDEYNRRLDHEKMNAVITAMFAILIIIFEASVTEYIISMDFAINGKEYIVRRINGCRYANVFKKLTIENTAMSLLSIGLYTAIIKAEDIGFYRFESVTSVAIIILMEIVVITVSINKFKKEATNKILKGGLL